MCSKSLKYTVIEDTINEIPSNKTYCTSKITGYSKTNFDNPIGEQITNANIIIVDIIKLTAPLVTTEIGRISLGKYTFLIIFPVSYNGKCCL